MTIIAIALSFLAAPVIASAPLPICQVPAICPTNAAGEYVSLDANGNVTLPGWTSTLVAERTVAPEELPFEFMLNALRLVEGFPLALFRERTGLPFVSIQKKLEEAERAGLLERDWQRLRPTARGRLFLNELLAHFLPENQGRTPI